MNKYKKRLLSFCLAFTMSNVNISCVVTEKTVNNFLEFAQIIFEYRSLKPESVALCCTDLDDTTLRYRDYIGTETWFAKVFEGLKNRGLSDPMQSMFFAAITAHQMHIDKNSVELTENSVVGIYNTIQSALHIPIIGLTSRTYILSDITKKQLASLQLKFSTPWADRLILNNDPTWRAMYNPEEGVVYCSGKNKGEILVELLNKTACSIPYTNKKIDTIIIIDNDQKHLTRIKDAIREKQLPVNLILVTYKPNNLDQVQTSLTEKNLQDHLDFILGMFQISQEEARRSQNLAINRLVKSLLEKSGTTASVPHRPTSCPPN